MVTEVKDSSKQMCLKQLHCIWTTTSINIDQGLYNFQEINSMISPVTHAAVTDSDNVLDLETLQTYFTACLPSAVVNCVKNQ